MHSVTAPLGLQLKVSKYPAYHCFKHLRGNSLFYQHILARKPFVAVLEKMVQAFKLLRCQQLWRYQRSYRSEVLVCRYL